MSNTKGKRLFLYRLIRKLLDTSSYVFMRLWGPPSLLSNRYRGLLHLV